MILNIYGYQDSGKTLTVEKLVKRLVQKGYRVASIKHSNIPDDIDIEGKDTWRHWKAGSNPVILSMRKGAVFFVHSGQSTGDLIDMLQTSFSPDVIILEGFKGSEGYPKVSVGDIQSDHGTIMSNPGIPELLAYVEKEVSVERLLRKLPGLDCGKCGLDCDSMARAIADKSKKLKDCREMPSRDIEIIVGGKSMALGTFVSEIVDDTIRGLLGSLKGYDPAKDVEIRLRANKPPSKRSRSKK